MIIRNNLASAPVKNYSLYFLGCVVLSIAALLFTIINTKSMMSWQSESGRLQTNISEQQKKRTGFQNEASQLRAKITQIKTPQFVTETQFMSDAIKRRTFSWTMLFDEFERIFPDNVKMVSVFPQIRDEKININMEVAGKALNDIVNLFTELQSSPAFRDVTLRGERQDSDGVLHANISLTYLPERLPTSAPQTAPAEPPEIEEQPESENETAAP
jgi:hypothetical protein